MLLAFQVTKKENHSPLHCTVSTVFFSIILSGMLLSKRLYPQIEQNKKPFTGCHVPLSVQEVQT
jgi:hypothetical protein